MSYEKKYNKYKDKYLNLKNLSMIGGANYEKTILLSCNEFNDVVDKLIALDIKAGPINLDKKSIDSYVNREHSGKSYYDKIKYLDSLEEKIEDDDRFQIFLDDNKSKIDSIKTIYKNQLKDKRESEANAEDKRIIAGKIAERNAKIVEGKYKKPFMRKLHNYETTNFFRGFINWRNYPDSTPDIKMNKQTVSKLRGAKIIYFAYFSFNEKEVTPIIDQLLFLNSLSHYGVGEINIVLPFFPVGTMERIVGEGEIPTGYSLAHMLNSIPNGASKNKIYIFDIHALCSRFFFHTNTVPILITMMSKYNHYINDKYNKIDNLNVIVFPDDGAKKRYSELVDKRIKTILCNKVRDGDKRLIKITEGLEILKNESGSRIVDKTINLFLIDDIVASGGTVLETLKGINKDLCKIEGYNQSKINFMVLITHSVLPGLLDEPDKDIKKFFSPVNVLEKDELGQAEFRNPGCSILNIAKLITTNSRPTKAKQLLEHPNSKDKVEIIDIADSFYEVYIDPVSELSGPYSLK
jgi:phosphoribosylpyrophosphate synthetase